MWARWRQAHLVLVRLLGGCGTRAPPQADTMECFLTQPAEVQDIQVLRFLDVHSAVNDCLYGLHMVHLCMFERGGKGDDLINRGIVVQRAKLYIQIAKGVVDACRSVLGGLPLKTTMHSLDQWLDAATVFAQEALELSISEACAGLNDVTKEVDALCPKWGSAVNDEEVHMEMATVMLLQNPNIGKLRDSLNSLWQGIWNIGEFGKCACLPPVAEYQGTRQWVELACNSLQFGKDTIKVTAACRVLIERRTDELATVMKHRAVFPKALVEKLLSLEGDAGQASAIPVMSAASGLKRKASSSKFDATATEQKVAKVVKSQPQRGGHHSTSSTGAPSSSGGGAKSSATSASSSRKVKDEGRRKR